jgi:hypothetical protein
LSLDCRQAGRRREGGKWRLQSFGNTVRIVCGRLTDQSCSLKV